MYSAVLFLGTEGKFSFSETHDIRILALGMGILASAMHLPKCSLSRHLGSRSQRVQYIKKKSLGTHKFNLEGSHREASVLGTSPLPYLQYPIMCGSISIVTP